MASAYNLRVFPSGDFSIAPTRPVVDSGDNPLKGINVRESTTGIKRKYVSYEAQPGTVTPSSLLSRFDALDRRITIATDGNVDQFDSVLRYLYEINNSSIPELLSSLWREFYEIIEAIERNKKHLAVRSPRGSKGISSQGRKKIRSAVALLQERHGKKNLSFVTYTIPTADRDTLHTICSGWSEIVRQTQQNLYRLLKGKGLDPDIAGAIEIQDRRFERTGYALPHIHIVCQGRTARSHSNRHTWDVSIAEYEDCYRRAIENVAGKELDFKAACNVQRVKKDAVSYLGKYLSKGSKDLQRFKSWGEKLPLPTAWYTCSKALLKSVRENTRNIGIDGSWVTFARALDVSGLLAYKGVYSMESGATVALFGRCRPNCVSEFITRVTSFLSQCDQDLHTRYQLAS